jgi:hypothetical protein
MIDCLTGYEHHAEQKELADLSEVHCLLFKVEEEAEEGTQQARLVGF